MTTSSPGSHSASSAAAIASVAPGGHEHLAVGVELDAVEAALVRGDRRAQLGDAGAGRVLVDAGAHGLHGGLEDLGRAVRVGEALAEVDRAGARGQRGHLREDRRAEALRGGEFSAGRSTTRPSTRRCGRRAGACTSWPRNAVSSPAAGGRRPTSARRRGRRRRAGRPRSSKVSSSNIARVLGDQRDELLAAGDLAVGPVGHDVVGEDVGRPPRRPARAAAASGGRSPRRPCAGLYGAGGSRASSSSRTLRRTSSNERSRSRSHAVDLAVERRVELVAGADQQERRPAERERGGDRGR